MAEAHPVGFRWVMKAKERGARVIHVDPRYGRTSQLADLHIPIRAGTDVAFLGGLIRHVVETESYFKEYVVNYTNACAIVGEDFRDTEELAGVFSGYDPETGTYDPSSWMYGGCQVNFGAGTHEHATQAFSEHTGAGMLVDELEYDETLENPRCVFQILRRHFARYMPRWCSVSAGSRARSSWRSPTHYRELGRERTGMFCYANGWTQHSEAVQMIRSAAILQLLLATSGGPAAASWRCAGTRH